MYYCIDTAKSGPKDKLIYQSIEELKEDKEAHKTYFNQLEVATWTFENIQNRKIIEELYYMNAFNENLFNSNFELHS